MNNRFFSFLLGIVFGYKGMSLVTHAVYLSIIAAMLLYQVLRAKGC